MNRKHDYIILIATAILSLIGLVTLISANIDLEGKILWEGTVSKQFLFIGTGILLYLFAWKFDYTYFKHIQVTGVIVLATIILLLITKLWGPVINNVQRWLIIGGFQVQPSEIAKLTVILMVAAVLSLRRTYSEWLLAAVSGLILLPILVLVYIQPHGSMSVILLGIWAALLFTFLRNQLRNFILLLIAFSLIVGVVLLSVKIWLWGSVLVLFGIGATVMGLYSKEQWRVFFLSAALIGLLLGLVGTVGWNNILRDYQKDRIASFLSEDTENCDNCFNVEQSKVAIGSGGLWGKGFGYGTQSRLKFLPEHQTDFIFATYAEQFGLVGSFFLLSLYGIIIYRILYHALTNKGDLFSSMLLAGIGIKLLMEVFINIGTNTGVIPATGSPLPLMSAGGSITLITFFSIGLVQSIITRRGNTPEVKDFIDKEDLLI